MTPIFHQLFFCNFYTLAIVFTLISKAVFAAQIDDDSDTKKKKLCVIYANCQLAHTYWYLKKYHADHYEVIYIRNWRVLDGLDEFPLEKIIEADVFIYQTINHFTSPKLNTSYIKENLLKKSCKCISVPFSIFYGYFPDYKVERDNTQTMRARIFRHEKINELTCEKTLTSDEIIEQIVSSDFLPLDYIKQKLENSLQLIEKNEQETDIKLYPFIRDHYFKKRLFFNPAHPTDCLLHEITTQIVAKLISEMNFINLEEEKKQINLFYEKTHPPKAIVPFIYPCVAEALGLKFDFWSAYLLKKPVDYIEYIEKYLEHRKFIVWDSE